MLKEIPKIVTKAIFAVTFTKLLGPLGIPVGLMLSENIANSLGEHSEEFFKKLGEETGLSLAESKPKIFGLLKGKADSAGKSAPDYSLARLLAKVWEERLAQLINSRAFDDPEFKKQTKLLAKYRDKFREAQNENHLYTLYEIFPKETASDFAVQQKTFETITNESEAQTHLWESLQKTLAQWTKKDEQSTFKTLENDLRKALTEDLQSEIAVHLKDNATFRESFHTTFEFFATEQLKQQGKTNEETNRIVKELREILKNPPKERKIPRKLPVSSFPARLNFFTGRGTILENIKTSLLDKQTAALFGVHGLGKSSIAVEFAYLGLERYEHVLFIRAVGAELDRFVGEIVADLPYPTDEQTTPDQKLAMLRHWLAENENWLLILDNVDDVSQIASYNFAALGGDILFTSNDDLIYQIGNRVEVPNMDAEEAASLLYQHWKGVKIAEFTDIPEEKHESAKQVAGIFGNSPLAMTFVGYYLAEEGESLTEFLETYQDKQTNLLATYKFLSSYQHEQVATPFLLAFEAITKLKNDSAGEILLSEILKDYLKLAAFLAPDDIPEEFLEQCVRKLHTDQVEALADNKILKKARKRLAKSTIFKRNADKKTFSTHRLVQEIMRFEIKDEENLLLGIISVTLEKNVPTFNYKNREQVESYLSHLQSFIEYLENFKTEIEVLTIKNYELVDILSFRVGRYYHLLGQYEIALKYYLISCNICENFFQNNGIEIAGTYNNLGVIYTLQGKYVIAGEYLHKSLQIKLKILGENHPSTTITLNNIGENYRLQGNYKIAEKTFLKTLAIQLNIFGKNHADTAGSYNNLGLVYELQDKFEKSEENHLKALQIRLNIFDENHPDTATSYNNLGVLYENQEKLVDAKRNYEKALEIYAKFLPEDHPNIQRAKNNLKRVREKIRK